MHTIWGKVQDSTFIERGVRWVSTASHGGLAVSAGVAATKLSEPALRFGETGHGYVYYEEDCAYAVALWERDEWRLALGKWAPTREQLFNALSDWYPEYLEAVGVAPDPERAARCRRLRAELDAWQAELRVRKTQPVAAGY